MRAAVLALTLAGLAAAAAMARDYTISGVVIGHPWSRPAAMGGTGAGYMTLTNISRESVTLTGVSSTAAASASMHKTTLVKGVYSMATVASLELQPGQSVTFAPGGYHIMFLGLKAPLVAGGRMPAALTFKRAGKSTSAPVMFDVDG